MPALSFEGETHDEITQKVRRWLASVDGDLVEGSTVADVVNSSAELTKDALQVIAASAPGPLAQSDLVKALTTMGYKATDVTKEAALSGIDAVETATGGSVVRNVAGQGAKAAWQMNAAIAKQILKSAVKS